MTTSSSDEILHRLKHYYSYTERQRDPFTVLISTILSQRTKDENTAKASQALFSKFDTPEKLAHADVAEVESLIKPSGFYHVKAERIKAVAYQILHRYGGRVPSTAEDLLSLPGVGRKTANCVLVYSFGIPAIPVDTHVHRTANRLALVSTTTPEETEYELMKIFSKKDWIPINHVLVSLGKEFCRPQTPFCHQCLLTDVCPTGQKETQQNL